MKRSTVVLTGCEVRIFDGEGVPWIEAGGALMIESGGRLYGWAPGQWLRFEAGEAPEVPDFAEDGGGLA